MPTTKRNPPTRGGGSYWFIREGDRVPYDSVTTALDEVAKHRQFVPAAIRKAYRYVLENPGCSMDEAVRSWYAHTEERADAGSLLHSWYEARGNGADLDLDGLPSHVRGHAQGFERWLDATEPEIVFTELTVGNDEYEYGGTMDLLAYLGNGELAVIDYKTGFVDPFTVSMQESAYAHAPFGVKLLPDGTQERIDLPQADARYVLQTKADGNYMFAALEDRWESFKAYLHIYRARADRVCPPACFCTGVRS